MPEKIYYGMLGTGEVTRDDDGYIEMPVIIEESGLYVGSAPPELRIHTVLPRCDPEFNKQWVAKLNRHADLPFYLGMAKIRVMQKTMTIITDDDLLAEGITPLEEE